MAIFLGILKFLFSSVAIFLTWVLILNIISSVINPQIILEEGVAVEKNNNARFLFALIIAICWAFVIVLP
jgi:hypothetical protein